MKSEAILITEPYRMEVGEFELPEPGAGEVLVRNRFTCVSPGTEMRVYSGEQEGKGMWPFIPGYSAVGQVERCGDGVSLEAGAWVFHSGTKRASVNLMWGAHSRHAVMPADGVEPLPEGVDPLEASAAKLGAIAWRGSRFSDPQKDECVAVVGLGPIGQLSARMHALSGAQVVAADISPERVGLLQKQGIEARVVEGDLVSAFKDVYPEGADVVVDATGSKAVLSQSIGLAREPAEEDGAVGGGRLLLQASYVDDVPVPYLGAFRKELKLLIPRANRPEDLRASLSLLAEGKIVLRDLISATLPPQKAAEGYQGLLDRRPDWLTVAVKW